jgi:murein DD-endopeptidase MepM/ murein hydrolase activator NlpD
VQAGGYGFQPLTIPEELEDLAAPEIRQQEDEFLATIYTNSAPEPLWEGLFQAPVTTTIVTAGYGDGRSYNGGPVENFHSGIDFAGTIGTPILAPATGVVVFADLLQLRGNTVIVDHGAGVMSAYFHLSEINVTVDEAVTQGQRLGAGGSTGFSTGPHLHWDIRINNTAVNGLSWLNTAYP